MAKITINFQDDIKFQRDLEAFTKYHGYAETIINMQTGKSSQNSQSKQEFAEATLKRIFKEMSKAQRTQDAINDLSIED